MHYLKVRFGARRDGDSQHPISLVPAQHGVRGLVDREGAVIQA